MGVARHNGTLIGRDLVLPDKKRFDMGSGTTERSVGQEGQRDTRSDGEMMTSGTEIQRHSSTVEWYGALTSKEKRTFWTCFGGWALDAMEVQILSFAG